MTSYKLTLTLAALAILIPVTARTLAQTPDAAAASSAAPKGGNPGDADGAFVTADKFSEPDGATMYKRVCAGCHMSDGKGAKGAGFYPALAGNPKLAAGGYPLYVIMHGFDGMPPVGQMMSDQQAADVVNYVRTHFGNKYKDVVTPAQAKAAR